MHLNEIKQRFPKAFKAYLEFLIEDCADDFFVEDNVLMVDVHERDDEMSSHRTHTLAWRPSRKKGDMSVGAGWENERRPEDEEDEIPFG